MKSKLIFIVTALIFYLPLVAVAEPVGKIDICHKAGTAAERILNINPEKDGPKHFGHGDYTISPEVCDGVDTDCDGVPDNSAPCDDGVACTDDNCSAGACNNVPNDSNCNAGFICDAVSDCVPDQPPIDPLTCPCVGTVASTVGDLWSYGCSVYSTYNTQVVGGVGTVEGTEGTGGVCLLFDDLGISGNTYQCAQSATFPITSSVGSDGTLLSADELAACREFLRNACIPGETALACAQRLSGS